MKDREFKAKNKDSDFSHKTAADTVLGRANKDTKDFGDTKGDSAAARNSRYISHSENTDKSGAENQPLYENQSDNIKSAEYTTDNTQPEQAEDFQADIRIDNKPDISHSYSPHTQEPPKGGFSNAATSAVKNRRYQKKHQEFSVENTAPSTEYQSGEQQEPQPKVKTEQERRSSEPPPKMAPEPAEDIKPTSPTAKDKYNIQDATRSTDKAFDRVIGKTDFQLGRTYNEKPTEKSAEPKKQGQRLLHQDKTADSKAVESTDAADNTELTEPADFQFGKQPEPKHTDTKPRQSEKGENGAYQKKQVKGDKSEAYNIKDAVDTKETAFDRVTASKDFQLGRTYEEKATEKTAEPKKRSEKLLYQDKTADSKTAESTDAADNTVLTEQEDFQLGRPPETKITDTKSRQSEKGKNGAYQKKRVKADKSEAYNIKDAVDTKETAFDRVTEPTDYEFQTQAGTEEYSFCPQAENTSDKAADTKQPRLRQDKRQSQEPIDKTDTVSDISNKGDFQFKRAERAQAKADSLKAKSDKAQAKLPHNRKAGKENVSGEQPKKSKGRLRFEDEPKAQRNLYGRQPARTAADAAGFVVSQKVHSKVRESEQDNSGVEAAHYTEEKAERLLQFSSRTRRMIADNRKSAPYKKAARLKFKAEKAEVKAIYEKTLAENPELRKKSAIKKFLQKKQIKKKYQQAKRAEQSAKAAKKSAKTAKDVTVKTAEFVWRHKKAFAVIILLALLVAWVASTVSSCAVMGTTAVNSILTSSYLSEDEDIYAAEDYYKSLETDLRSEIDNIESVYSGYDEYNYDLAQIGHNPYELISYLTAKYMDFVFDDTIKSELDALFAQQYTLTISQEVETYTDAEGNDYDYYILNVTLTNNGISMLANTNLTEEQRELYGIYMSTKGNRDYLFEDDIYSNPAVPPDYTIPGEALTDETFRRLITEAEKYLGYPYVWGGSNPSTSFDCSGFVCWVFQNSGVYPLSRTTAQGIFNQCAVVSRTDAKPGDIIFFTGTYNAGEPVTHVGIYVGNGMMIHCGNPIQYASIESAYWSQHFYAFGRLGGG